MQYHSLLYWKRESWPVVAMFLRRTTRTHKGKTYVNYQLVESVRTPKGPRQNTICSLGDLGPGSREEWARRARKLEHAVAGQEDLLERSDPEVDRVLEKAKAKHAADAQRTAQMPGLGSDDGGHITVDPKLITTELHREAGTVHVGYQFWRRIGLDEILEQQGLSERARQLASAMTMNRLIHPVSENAMPAWIRRTALADILGRDFDDLAEDALYRVLDALHPHRAAIETALVERERSLFNLDPTIYLYDLTSTYFEGLAAANPKAKRGHTRDGRPDCKQVVIGLVVGREGFPICHEVFAGNTQDVTTLETMLDRLAARGCLTAGATIVMDRGMASAENILLLASRKLHYIIASRQTERDRWLASFADDVAFTRVIRQPSPTNPNQKKTRVDVQLVRSEGCNYVLCRSEQRIEKDKAIREKHEQRLIADLEKLSKRIASRKLTEAKKIDEAIGRLKERYPRVARFYEMSRDAKSKSFAYKKVDAKYGVAQQLDGTYLLKTDRTDISADEGWRIYTLLSRAEDAFRDMKSPLAERPIFHHLEHRVESHVFVCLLAFHLLVAIEKTLLDQGVHTSWATVRDVLKTHQVSTVVLPTITGRCLRIRMGATPDPEVKDLYKQLHVSEKVITPIRSWSRI
jgi:transposase